MAFRFHAQKTITGYSLGECTSALQKSIRKGRARDALYWAMEIGSISSVTRKYLWNRLNLICAEDVGPTQEGILAMLTVDAMEKKYLDAVQRDSAAGFIFLSYAIIAMCNAPKTRIAENLHFLVLADTQPRLEIPDEAYDNHTWKGKKLGRGKKFFRDVSSRVEPEVDVREVFGEEYGEWQKEYWDISFKEEAGDLELRMRMRESFGKDDKNTATAQILDKNQKNMFE